jgi:hypothetical protein
MITLSSKLPTLESKVLPGVRVHLLRFTSARRAEVSLQLAEYRAKMADIYRRQVDAAIVPDETDELGTVTRPGDPPEVRQRKAIQCAALSMEGGALEEAYILPATLRTYVERVEGLEIDGQAITGANINELAPPQFSDEIYRYIEENNGLPPFGPTGSLSPSPSPTAADGGSQNMIATAAAS